LPDRYAGEHHCRVEKASLAKIYSAGDHFKLLMNRPFVSTRVADFLLRTQVVWVAFAVVLVYVSVVLDIKACAWVGLAIAFASFPLRLMREGHLSQRTPFDIPLIILFAGVIVGVSVSDHLAVSLGALQTFLAMSALYYAIINHRRYVDLIKWGLGIVVLGTVIGTVIILPLDLSSAYHFNLYYLGIWLAIVAAIAIGIAIFSRGVLIRTISALLCSAFLGLTIFFLYDYGGLQRVFSLSSIVSRMPMWQSTLDFMSGSTVFTGLGLGCWYFSPVSTYEHLHNAYIGLYVHTGVLGIVALIVAVGIGAKLAVDIVCYSPRKHPYYGFGIGVLLAILVAALAGTLEITPFAIPGMGSVPPFYLLSPIPWLLAAALVMAHRLLRQPLDEALVEQKEQ
jgi:hypothetical protein